MSEDSNKNTNNSKFLQKYSQPDYGSILNLNNEQLKVLETLAKGANTGVKNVGDAILILAKSQELGIGFGNALPHMHVVNGKPGIDIHIIKAVLGKPGTGVRWIQLKDYEPVYRYFDKTGNIYDGKDALPEDYIILPTPAALKEYDGDKYPVTYMVSGDGKKVPFKRIDPIDYVSSYKFIRKKKDIDGTYFTETLISSFTWRDAIKAQLPFNRAGEIDPNSAWSKYRRLMVNTRAFTFGAREIASDLLMGNYETTELYDMEHVDYEIINDNDDPQVSTINVEDNNS